MVVVPAGESARAEFDKRLARLNTKAERFGLPPVGVLAWEGPVRYVACER